MNQDLETEAAAKRYLHRAEEIRVIAESSSYEEIKRVLLGMAKDYESMAQKVMEMQQMRETLWGKGQGKEYGEERVGK